MNEAVQRAYVATVIRPDVMATGYGLYHAVVGFAALPAGVIGGVLWQYLGSRALFLYGSCMSIVAAILFFVLLRASRNRS
jgi:predicted MFS family arabinose efflux permease